MKNLFILILSMAFMFNCIWAGKIEVKKTTIIRSAVMAKDNVGTAHTGDVYTVLEEIGSWHYIKIDSGSDNVGKQGWVWRKLVDGKKIIGDTTKSNPGVKLHEGPSKKTALICKVKAGATYTLIKKLVKLNIIEIIPIYCDPTSN